MYWFDVLYVPDAGSPKAQCKSCRLSPSARFTGWKLVEVPRHVVSARKVKLNPGSVPWNSAEMVAARATRGLSPGAILLMHEGPGVPGPIRVEAIRRVLERLQQQGYQCVVPGPDQLVA